VNRDITNTSDSMKYLRGQRNTDSTTVTAVAAVTKAVVFATPFPVGVTPNVHVNFTSSAGAVNRWLAKAVSITNVGFTILYAAADNVAATFTATSTWVALV
jgi:hypothetical protein